MADENCEKVSEEDAGEDVPSNFFDDFEKDDFLKGLEVIDSVNENDGKENKSKNKLSSNREHRSTSSSRLDEYIKPGSRRDPEKTNAAIRRDKEVKVKEHLAKHLESQDDLRPPGTELDDFFNEARPSKIRKRDLMDLRYEVLGDRRSGPREHDSRRSPRWRSPSRYPQWRENRGPWRGTYHGARYYIPRHTHRFSPGHSPRRSPKFVLRHSPSYRSRHSPRRSPVHSRRRSPRHSPRNSPSRSSRHSPRLSMERNHRRSPKHSPNRSSRRRSSQHSPRRTKQQDTRSNPRSSRTRSTPKHSPHWSPRRSPQRSSKTDHYSKQPSPKRYSPHFNQPHYFPEVPPINPHYVYTFEEAYNPYAAQPGPSEMSIQAGPHGMDIPQPVPMPINPVPAPMMTQPNPHMNYMVPEPVQTVPPPQMMTPPLQPSQFQQTDEAEPYDALAQLVAEGTLSQEDYLKLTPSIKGGNSLMDDKTRITVLTRCNQAVLKLNNMKHPFRFWIENNMKFCNEMLGLPQKYASPLKRQVPIEFDFTKPENPSKTQNRQLINNIITAIGLEKSFIRKKVTRDVKSVGVQTMKPYCDMCEIRDSTKKCSVGFSTDPLFLTNTVHTQVVEQDLLNSKAIFNPSGSVGDGAPISIAHLTPAQLVSQLAARAKTFQQAEPREASNQVYPRRNPPNYYDDGRGGAQHYNQNYRYHY